MRVTREKGAKEEEGAEDKGGFRVLFGVPFPECISKGKIVHKEDKGAVCTKLGYRKERDEQADGFEGRGVMTENIPAAVAGGGYEGLGPRQTGAKPQVR